LYRSKSGYVSNAVWVKLDFEGELWKVEFESEDDDGDREAYREAYEVVMDCLKEGAFAFQVGKEAYVADADLKDQGDERVGWDDLTPTARRYAVSAVLRLGLEKHGFERGYGGGNATLVSDRDFFEVCYGGRFDGRRIRGVFGKKGWRRIRSAVLQKLRDRYAPVDVQLALRTSTLESKGKVLLSVDPRARAVTRVPLKDLVEDRGRRWAERTLPGTRVIPVKGSERYRGRSLEVVSAVPADEWSGSGDLKDVDDLRGYWWETHRLRVDPSVVVEVAVGSRVLAYPDDVLPWRVPVHEVSRYFRLGPADRTAIGRHFIELGLESAQNRFSNVTATTKDHPRPGVDRAGRLKPPEIVARNGKARGRRRLKRLLEGEGPFEGGGELDGRRVSVVCDRRLLKRGVSRGTLRRLLRGTVTHLRRLHHDVDEGRTLVVSPTELPDRVERLARNGDLVLAGVPHGEERGYAAIKRRCPEAQCFTERASEHPPRLVTPGLAIGLHCKHAGQPFAVRTEANLEGRTVILGVDVSRKVEGDRVVEGRGCCACFTVDEDGTIRHERTFTTTIGERGETSGKVAEALLQDLSGPIKDADRVIYLRDGPVPKDELRTLLDEGPDPIVLEVIKSNPTVHAVCLRNGITAPNRAYVRIDERTAFLYPSQSVPGLNRTRDDAKPGTRRPILIRRRDGGALNDDLLQLLYDLTLSNWGTPTATSRLPAPVLYADRAARLARYGVTVSPREELAKRPWPV